MKGLLSYCRRRANSVSFVDTRVKPVLLNTCKGDASKASELNREFHLAVVAVAEMPIMLPTVEMMWARMGALIYRVNVGSRASQNYGSNHERYRVVDSLRARNPELAKLSIQNDIRFSCVGILTPGTRRRPSEPGAAQAKERRTSPSLSGDTYFTRAIKCRLRRGLRFREALWSGRSLPW
jgi:hypothetical protein